MTMTVILKVLLFLHLLFPVPQFATPLTSGATASSGGGITRIQTVTHYCSSGTTCSVTLTSTGAGHFLMASFSYRNDSSQSASSVYDCTTVAPCASSTNPFTCDYNQTGMNGGHYTLEMCSAPNISASQVTVTVNFPTSGAAVVITSEYSGVVTSSPLDKVTATAATNSASPYASTATATTSQAKELLCGVEYNNVNDTSTFAGTGGWNVEGQTGDVSDGTTFGYSDQIVSTTGAYQNTGTISPSTSWDASIATYKSQ